MINGTALPVRKERADSQASAAARSLISAAVIVPISLQRVRSRVKGLLDCATTIRAAQESLKAAQVAAAEHASDHLIQSLILQLKEKAGQHEGLSQAWAALCEQHPNDLTIFRFHLRRLIREHHEQQAMELLEERLPEDLDKYDAAFARAELLDDIQAFDEADRLFRILLGRYGDKRELCVSFAKRLRKRGLIADALDVIEPVMAKLPEGSKSRQLAAELAELNAFFRRYESAEVLRGRDARVFAMKHAILHFRNRSVAPSPNGQLGALALVTGSLGPGGAERQLSRLASLLETSRTDGTSRIDGPIEVIVKSHGSERRNDFFLPDLLKHGVTVRQLNEMPAIPARKQDVVCSDLLQLLEFLPAQVHYGVTRLAPHLSAGRFQVVSLWQDGTCLFGALAALLAGAPVIQLVFRGLPPNIRHDRFKPEYDVLLKALAQVPGVQFISNSRTAAREYAAWLDIPFARFMVLYNGVPPLNTEYAPEDDRLWSDFVERTAEATETIGGVFRFESDKHPMQWIRMAKRYLKRRPKARFLIVGHGRLFPDAVKLAEELGVSARTLFVGQSNKVGFWYSKMDVKVLLSRFEGLPNVLIEAQSLGVPVVSTPAGGAEECFLEGVTGHILDCTEKPCLDEACEKIAALAVRDRKQVGDEAVRFVSSLFSVSLMLNQFIDMSTVSAGGSAETLKLVEDLL